MADLLTLSELRTARGDAPSDTSNDGRYTWMIPVASQLIRSYSGRDFGAAQITETRSFTYDGSGFLDIDDATSVQQVAIPDVTGIGNDLVLNANQWVAMPPRRDDSPVFWYIIVPGFGASPGF